MKKVISVLVLMIMIMSVSIGVFAADEEIADFSKAKFEFVYSGKRNVHIKVSGVTISQEELSLYKVAITTSKTEPAVDDDYDFFYFMRDENGAIKTNTVENYLELNYEKYYVWVYNLDYKQSGKDKYKLLRGGVELTRQESPKYSDVFSATHMANGEAQIIMNVPWSDKTLRKMHIKVGVISDANTLNKIKDGNVVGMQELLSFAQKSNNTIFNKTVNSTVRSDYHTNGYNDKIDITYDKLNEGAYYYLYVKLDDENGKYYPVEGVSLAQAKKYDINRQWFMFFLGEKDFSWSGLADPEPTNNVVRNQTPTQTTDTSVSNRNLPYTGKQKLIFFTVFTLFTTVVLFYKYRDYKDI